MDELREFPRDLKLTPKPFSSGKELLERVVAELEARRVPATNEAILQRIAEMPFFIAVCAEFYEERGAKVCSN